MKTIVKTILLGLGIAFMMSACGGGGNANTSLPPSIITQPSSVTMVAGNSATFSVSASGTGLSYQWQVDSGSGFANISDTGVYSGTSTATLSLADVTISMNSNKYRVVVTGDVAPSATSTSAILTVVAPTQAVVTVSIAGILPGHLIENGLILFTLDFSTVGVTPKTFIDYSTPVPNLYNAIGSVAFLTTRLAAIDSDLNYNTSTNKINFSWAGINPLGLINEQLLEITFTVSGAISRSDFNIITSSLADFTPGSSNPNPTVSFPLNVVFTRP